MKRLALASTAVLFVLVAVIFTSCNKDVTLAPSVLLTTPSPDGTSGYRSSDSIPIKFDLHDVNGLQSYSIYVKSVDVLANTLEVYLADSATLSGNDFSFNKKLLCNTALSVNRISCRLIINTTSSSGGHATFTTRFYLSN